MNTTFASFLRRVASAALLVILAGCGGGGGGGGNAPPVVPPPVVVGSAGGVVNGPDGVTVTIPPGALAADTTLKITAATAADLLPLPGGISVEPKMYSFLPHGTIFSVPATLTLPRLAGQPDDGRSILKTNATGTAWEQLATTSVGNADSALITSFSGGGRMCGPGPGPCGGPLPAPPVISMQPVSGSVDEGGFVFLAVTAIGTPPLTFQWQNNRIGTLTRETTSAIVINPITLADDGLQLSVIVTDRYGQSVSSAPATINVRAGAPVVLSPPGNIDVVAGATATFHATTISSVAQTLRWERFDPASGNWGAAGSTSNILTLPNVQFADDQALFRLTAANDGVVPIRSVSTPAARLTVRPAEAMPIIVGPPADFATVAGRSASFTVVATGGGLDYRWERLDAMGVWGTVGGNSAVLTVSNTVVADDGASIRVRVSNTIGFALSATVRLGVSGSLGESAVRLRAGRAHSVALKADGSLLAWGLNPVGQLGRNTFSSSEAPGAVLGLAGVATFAVGYDHGMALLGDGSLHVWGYNSSGQLGDGSMSTRLQPASVSVAGSPFRYVAAGEVSSIAGDGLGGYLSWGLAYHGDGTFTTRDVPTRIAGPTFLAASIGARARHTLARDRDGNVWSWGSNLFGELGTGDRMSRTVPTPVTGVARVIAVAAGTDHSLALTDSGVLYAWGRNTNGQLGTGAGPDRLVPVAVSLPGIVVGIAAGKLHSLAVLSDGRVFAWGDNADGQLGDGTQLTQAAPVPVSGGWAGGIVSIGAGERHSLALDAAGDVWAWGFNDRMQLGDGTTTTRIRPVQTMGVNLD